MNGIMNKLENLCDHAEGLACLATMLSASADTAGIDRRALKGLAFDADRLSEDLQLICDELHMYIRYHSKNF